MTSQDMVIRGQAVIKSSRIWMLRRHPVINAVASNDMLVRLATRTDAAGLTASEHQCAAMQIDQCATSIKLPVRRRDMDRCLFDYNCLDCGLQTPARSFAAAA